MVHIPTNYQISRVAQNLSGNNFADNEAVQRSRGPSESHHEAGVEKMPKLTLQLISQI